MDIEGKILLFNREFERLFNIALKDFVGLTRNSIMSLEVADEHRSNDLVIINTKKAATFEEVNIELDIKHHYLTVKFPVFNAVGEVYAVGGISTDITERKKTEEELKNYREHLEEIVKDRTLELEGKNKKLDKLNKIFVGRELRMTELKKEIEKLKNQ
ncbi:PAS domain-containing protein [Flavobacterium sp. K5-23]|uniref:PAS domain-containing protein n=1 Tax=Flavobacterium sp. K5-23 TaxID=2746225 RepID=UPI00200CD865|nr:PAS domain-containing protein [Flavobacterium sp. K5-23]UQD56690.1 PAS domain-containing protein [Flavobacterium sp. K5-23]